jgi:hypothetical protein
VPDAPPVQEDCLWQLKLVQFGILFWPTQGLMVSGFGLPFSR